MVSHVWWNNWSNRTHQLVTNKTKMASHRFIKRPGETLFKLFNHCWTLERVRNLFALWMDDLAEGWKWGSFLTLRNKPSQRAEWDSDTVFLYYFFYLIKGAVSWKLSNFKQWQLPPIWVKLKSNWSKHEKKMLKPVVRYIIHEQKETGKDKLVQQKKKTETYCNCGFWKLVSLTVFHFCCLQRLI